MNPSLLGKLQQLRERQEEINRLLSDPGVIAEQQRFRQLSIELADISPVVELFSRYQSIRQELVETKAMCHDPDASIQELAENELPLLRERSDQLRDSLRRLLLPKDPKDERNIFLEIRAGTGGDEAALFAGNLFRMYSLYAQQRHWQVEVVSQSTGEHGGFKEIISRVVGHRAYSYLKFESGAHRVQRVPETEAQGRIHTSACTVAILPEVDAIDHIEINSADLRIDTYRASGAGGQHVNRTDSAVRITHLPSGLVVECQDERSQHKNKARAMSVLSSRLLEQEIRRQHEAEAETRRNLVGSGDRSERIRTYNYPQGRVTDHRIGLTVYKLDEVLQGQLDHVIKPLINEYQADQLAAMSGG